MPDLAAAKRIETAVQMMRAECEGAVFETRRRFAIFLPILRGHKVTFDGLKEQPYGLMGQCEVCGQVVTVKHDGTNVEGRAVENDCPAAEWRRPD